MTPASATTLAARVHDRLAERTGTATVRRCTVGERLLQVEVVVDGRRVAGVAHRPPGDVPAVDGDADALAVGRDAVERDDPPARAVGLATLNALSAPHVDWLRGDPMAALSADVSTVATVGLFRPAFRKFGGVDVRVVERDAPDPDAVDAPPGVSVSLFAPPEARAAFAGADVLFVTGATLIYGGIDRYLAVAAETGVPAVVLVGGTASFLPEPAFEAGVDLLAGAEVTDADRVRARTAAGECATDLHGSGLEKVYAADRAAPGIALPAD